MHSALHDYIEKNPLGLSPLSEIGDSPFRRICRYGGAGILIAPMVAARHIINNPNKLPPEMSFRESEHPIGIQLLVSNPNDSYKASQILALTDYDFIELNASCPSRRIVTTGSGAALLKNSILLKEILAAVNSGAPQKPLTIKIRLGLYRGDFVAPDLIASIQEIALNWITVHGRYADDKLTQPADWQAIKITAYQSPFPVIGNGDITELAQGMARMEEAGLIAVMVGRGALGKPWMFRKQTTLDLESRLFWIKKHWKMQLEEYGEAEAAVRFRKHLVWFSHGLRYGRELRRRLPTITSIKDINAVLNLLDSK